MKNLVVCVLVDDGWLQGMKERCHQPLTLPQSLSSFCPVRADIPAGETVSKHLSIFPIVCKRCRQAHLRHPDVFLKTVVHSALCSFEESAESLLLQPECGMMISSVRVWSPWLMTIILRGSCEERFHRVPANGAEEAWRTANSCTRVYKVLLYLWPTLWPPCCWTSSAAELKLGSRHSSWWLFCCCGLFHMICCAKPHRPCDGPQP